MTNEEIIDVVRKIIEYYSWSSYNPKGQYVNVTFTFKGVDMYKKINDLMKECKVTRIEVK